MADSFISAIKLVFNAEDKTANAIASLRTGLSSVESKSTSLRNIFGTIVPVVSVAGMLAYTKTINDGVDALNDLKDSTGASIENISALEDVADRTGTSFDTVGSALIKFNAVLNESTPDSEASRALKAIGLEAKALKDIDPAEALRRTAVALGRFADDGNKARLAQVLFGKSLREVAPLLNDLKEQGALNARVTTEQADAAERFNKQLFELQKNAKDTGRALVSDIIPYLSQLIQEFALGKQYADGFFDALFTYGVKYGPDKDPVERIRDITTEIINLKKERSSFGSLQSLVDGDRIDADTKRLERQLGYFKALQRLQIDYSANNQSEAEARRLGLSSGPAPSVKFSAGAKSGSEQINEQRTSLAAYVKQLNEELNTINKISESQQALNFLASQGTQGQVPQVRELVLGLAARVDQEKKIVEVMRQQTQLQKEIDDAYRNRLQGMLDSGPKAQLEKTRGDIQLLTAEFEEGRISEEKYLDAVTGRLNLVADGLEESKSAAEEFGFTFNSALEDAVINGKDLSEVIQALGQDIARMVVRKTVTEPLGNAVGNFFSGIDFGSLFSFDGGGSTGSGSRSGGLDGKGGFLAVMHPQETVIDHTRVGSANGQPIVQNFNFNGPADRGQVITAAQLGAAMAREQARDDRARGRA